MNNPALPSLRQLTEEVKQHDYNPAPMMNRIDALFNKSKPIVNATQQ